MFQKGYGHLKSCMDRHSVKACIWILNLTQFSGLGEPVSAIAIWGFVSDTFCQPHLMIAYHHNSHHYGNKIRKSCDLLMSYLQTLLFASTNDFRHKLKIHVQMPKAAVKQNQSNE